MYFTGEEVRMLTLLMTSDARENVVMAEAGLSIE